MSKRQSGGQSMNIRDYFEELASKRGLVMRRVFGDEAETEGLETGDYLFQETRMAWEWFRITWNLCMGLYGLAE